MNEGVTPGLATAILTGPNDRHHRACPALALVILLWIDFNRMALLARLRRFLIIGGKIVLDLPHLVTGTHIRLDRLTGMGQALCEMSPLSGLHQNGSELEVHPLVDEVAHSHSVAPRSANMEIDVSIVRHREVGVGFLGAVRHGDAPLVGDEIVGAKIAAGLVLRENGQDHLYGIEDFDHHPTDGLAHPAVMSTVIGILDIFLNRHLGFRCGLQTQERRQPSNLALMKQ